MNEALDISYNNFLDFLFNPSFFFFKIHIDHFGNILESLAQLDWPIAKTILPAFVNTS